MTFRLPPDPPGSRLQSDLPKDLYISHGQHGLMQNNVFITDPFVSECGRFPADPIEDYGLTDEQVAQIKADKAED